MSVIYSDAWYQEMKELINGSEKLAELAPKDRIAVSFEVVGDGVSPYVAERSTLHFLIVLEGGRVEEFRPLSGRHDGRGLAFRFTAPATVWESVANGKLDPITAGLRGKIAVRGDMRFLMENADAVKLLVDRYASQVNTEWPEGEPPYTSA